jgi:hypothetical protein
VQELSALSGHLLREKEGWLSVYQKTLLQSVKPFIMYLYFAKASLRYVGFEVLTAGYEVFYLPGYNSV